MIVIFQYCKKHWKEPDLQSAFLAHTVISPVDSQPAKYNSLFLPFSKKKSISIT